MGEVKNIKSKYTSTSNACRLCSPLGASMAYKGVKNCVPIVHGSQGCATYIRRYLISHYREPFDIASSSFSEEAAVFGGQKNLNMAIDNISEQYKPDLIGICTTCLSETIGEDVKGLISQYKVAHKNEELPAFSNASTPSYQGSHADGFHETVKSMVKDLAVKGENEDRINIFPGFISPADLRHIKYILAEFGLNYTMLSDYSETADNPNWKEYKRMPEGGTTVEQIKDSANAFASIELGNVFNRGNLNGRVRDGQNTVETAGEYLSKNFGVVNYQSPLPIGIDNTDKFFDLLEKVSGNKTPEHFEKERGRLIDAYVDGHKVLFGKKAIVYGEEDLVISLTSFLEEIGIDVVMAISGGNSGELQKQLEAVTNKKKNITIVGNDLDFEDMREIAEKLDANIMIGNSKGYYISRKMKIPLVRVGFPVHDRVGSQRILHVGYAGTQELFDKVANALLEYKQENSDVGYKYL